MARKKKQSGEETHRIVSGNYRKPTAKKAHRKQNESNEIMKKKTDTEKIKRKATGKKRQRRVEMH